ncbi:hypothetical protein DI392_06105 [Vibrio albus]|uniref:Resolvase/invertase-type recombinase catalytic domain-containing protein n=2 Tax=Vibrio albus TaxID=2200953 RepID=A0A2U3BD23_9VIBR|nr:hypothetical protein DI392_06105 [Vibrio albus]
MYGDDVLEAWNVVVGIGVNKKSYQEKSREDFKEDCLNLSKLFHEAESAIGYRVEDDNDGDSLLSETYETVNTVSEPLNETFETPCAHTGQHIGYIRVSTVDQKTDRQLAGVELDKRYEEKVSASTIKRPQLEAAKDFCREGDTLHIHSLDRVCRSGAGDAVSLVEEMNAKGVTIVFHKEGMTFSNHYGAMNAAQKGVLSILASVAEMERGLIRERQLEGIAVAKAKGKHMGRPKGSKVSKADVVAALEAGKQEELTKAQVAKKLGIGRATLYRILNQ